MFQIKFVIMLINLYMFMFESYRELLKLSNKQFFKLPLSNPIGVNEQETVSVDMSI